MRVRGGQAPALRFAIAGARPPRYGLQGRLPITVGRWPVPRQAIGYANTRGGNPLGCACGMRGPRATVKKWTASRRARACPSPGKFPHAKCSHSGQFLPTFHTPQSFRCAGLPHIVHRQVSYVHFCAVSPQIRVIAIGIIFANSAVVRRTKS